MLHDVLGVRRGRRDPLITQPPAGEADHLPVPLGEQGRHRLDVLLLSHSAPASPYGVPCPPGHQTCPWRG
ncbi:hypothetical protein PV382_06295 [Streptomyces scabiei]|uniref:hypothetical protein n=1 Tax=Streptomyces scabiei TaxID=1930 RepID=UPI0005A0B5BD|nr:hypothetical protein [Streptomyces scabiei]MDX3171906.1 hypothetical protein [Streptomyces scabiei]